MIETVVDWNTVLVTVSMIVIRVIKCIQVILVMHGMSQVKVKVLYTSYMKDR